MSYAIYVGYPKRRYLTIELVERRMSEIDTAYKKWKAEYRASDPDRTDPNDDYGCEVQEHFVRLAQEVASDMFDFNLIPTETLNDPYFDLWTFGCNLFDWWCVERHW